MLRKDSAREVVAALIYRPGSAEEERIPLRGDRFMIGNASGNDIRLPHDNWVSRYHCRLERTNGGWVLKDNTTVHGTMVDGDLVLSHALVGGEMVMVGQTPFRFVLDRPE
jgi:pSer/pThr/pTyr-binding forkhead associated (FHA) protein